MVSNEINVLVGKWFISSQANSFIRNSDMVVVGHNHKYLLVNAHILFNKLSELKIDFFSGKYLLLVFFEISGFKNFIKKKFWA